MNYSERMAVALWEIEGLVNGAKYPGTIESVNLILDKIFTILQTEGLAPAYVNTVEDSKECRAFLGLT